MNNKYLFVCVGNVDRSKAGEDIFKVMLRERGFSVGEFFENDGFDFYVGSAGIEVSQAHKPQSVQLTRVMTRRAGRIFSVEDFVTKSLVEDYNVSARKIIQLDIEDGRSLIIEEEAQSLYSEFRRKLRDYLPRKVYNK
jgi:protein-tyrosine-phosphatase